MVEIVVGSLVDGHALRRQSVPRPKVERKQRCHGRALVRTEVVPPYLRMVVGQRYRKRG